MILVFLSLVVATLASAAECLPLENDIILGRHLSAAVKGGASLPADAVFSSAPLPGVTRTVSATEIVRWAKRNGVSDISAVDACFEWPLRILGPEEATLAMRAVLPPGTAIRIVELSRQGVPVGKVVFLRSGLREPADSANTAVPVLWHGFVEYGHNKRYATWARVNLQIQSQRVSATAAIRAGEVIRRDQIREETVSLFPARELQSQDASAIIGRVARSPIRTGGSVHPVLLNSPLDVKKGDIVELELRSTRTVVRAQGEAQSSGRIGDKLRFRNSSSGKLIYGRLVTSARAEVVSANQPPSNRGGRR